MINEISRSKIKNKMVIMKKFVENGVFNEVFSLNPHSKLVLVLLYFLLFMWLIVIEILNIKLLIMVIVIIKYINEINFLSF